MRLENLLEQNCRCTRKDCFHRLRKQADAICEFVKQFYELSKLDQDDFAFRLHICFQRCCFLKIGICGTKLHENASSSSASGKSSYCILGENVGLECLSGVLGISKRRMLKAKTCAIDLRFGDHCRPSPKTHAIDRFLFDLHGSIAETLPTQSLSSLNTCNSKST